LKVPANESTAAANDFGVVEQEKASFFLAANYEAYAELEIAP
jgi:hypothetical protein